MENILTNRIYKLLTEAKKISTTYPDKSYDMCKEAYHISKEHHLKVEEGYSFVGISFACRAKSEINKMLDYSYKALEIFEAEQIPLGQIKSLNLIGIAFFYNSIYETALTYLYQVVTLLDKVKDDFLLSCVLNNIGEVFRESGKHDKALDYYYRALKISTDHSLKINIATISGNIGEIFFLENKYDEALEYYTKSYDVLIEEKDMVLLGDIENKLGKIHYINGNYSKAEEYFISALSRLKNVNNKFYAIDVLVNIAILKYGKDSNKSFYYFEKAIQYADNINAKKKLSDVYKTVAEYYEKTGNYRVALEYFKKHSRINEEIMISNMGNKLEILKIELENLKENDKFEKIKIINQRLEMEILNQKKKLMNTQKENKILEKKAHQDELTGIPNRRYINNYLSKAWEKLQLYDNTITLFIIDIDNFKKYNDYWGHSKGDECLIEVTNCMKNMKLQRKDLFGRYGGEEFIYYIIGINYDQALALGNLIRNKVEKLGLTYIADDNSYVITLSVGGAFGNSSYIKSISDMIQIADMELYKAKGMGRNHTCINNLIE